MTRYELAGHASFALIALSFLVKDILWLRVLSVAASVAGIAYNYFGPATPLWLVIYWNIFFLVINLTQIALILRDNLSDFMPSFGLFLMKLLSSL